MAFGDIRGTLSVAANSITNPTNATGSVSVSVGDLVYCVLVEQTNLTVTGVTSSLVTTYSALNAGNDAVAVTARSFWGLVTSAGTLTSVAFAATASGDNVVALAVVFEGPFDSSPLDANPSNGTADTTSPFSCPATGTLAQADELVVGWVAANHNTAYTADSPMTERLELASQTVIKGNIASKVVSSTTTTTPSFTSGTNPTNIVLGTSSFKKDLLQALTPSLFTDSDSIPAPTVTPGAVDIAPSLFDDTEAFFAPTISATYDVAPSLFDDTDTFFAPTFDQGVGGQDIAPSLFNDADSFFAPTVTPGAVDIAPSLFSDTDSFFAPTSTATADIAPSLYTDTDQFFAPTVSATYDLAPSLFNDADIFFAPTVSATADIAPSLYADADSFFAPTVSGAAGDQVITPSLYSDTDVFFVPTVALSEQFLTPALFVDSDSIFQPTIALIGGLVRSPTTGVGRYGKGYSRPMQSIDIRPKPPEDKR